MKYVGTAINVRLSLREPDAEQVKMAATHGVAAEDVLSGSLLLGIHSIEGVRVDNPDAVEPKNKHTYFSILPVTIAWPVRERGKVAFCHLVCERGVYEVFLPPSGITSRVVVLAEDVRPTGRRLSKGEQVFELLAPCVEGTFVVPSQMGRLATLFPNRGRLQVD